MSSKAGAKDRLREVEGKSLLLIEELALSNNTTPHSNLALGQFQDQKYLSLRTFRKSGEAVATPVWFVLNGSTLYIRTPGKTGKVKRLRNDTHVQIVPCTRDGKPLGEWIDASAQLISGQEARENNRLLTRKYGLLKRLSDVWTRITGSKMAFIAVEL